MKIKSYILACMLIFLISCAEEGPFKLGNLEYNVETSMVTSTTAILSVNIPKESNNIITTLSEVYVVDKEYNYAERPNYNNLINGSLISEKNDETCQVFFQHLTPKTTYYVLIGSGIDLNGNDSDYTLMYTGYSFTTAESGDNSGSDNSGLGELTCETCFIGADFTIFRLTAPDEYRFSHINKIEWGLNIEDINSEVSKFSDFYQESSIYVYIPKLFNKDEKIYFKFTGNIINRDIHEELQDIKLNVNITFDPDKRIIPNPEFTSIFNGNDFCIGSISYPQGINMSSGSPITYFINNKKDFSDSNLMSINSGFKNDHYLYISNPDPKLSHYLRVKCDDLSFGEDEYEYGRYIKLYDATLDLSGDIPAAQEGVYLYTLNEENQEDGSVKFTLSCDDIFLFTDLSSSTILKVSQKNDSYVFSVNYSSSTSNTIEFVIDPSKMSSLQQGEEYKVSFSGFNGFNLLYDDEIIVRSEHNIWREDDIYWLWTPYPSESGEMETPKLIRANDSTGAGSYNVATR